MTSSRDTSNFVYVSNAGDGDISVYRMDSDGVLTSLDRAIAGEMVMPMAVSVDKRHLYAAVRSKPFRVVAYRIDADSGVLVEVATSALADSMAYISTDRTGRWLFGASYGGDVVSVNRIDADGLPQSEGAQLIKTGRHAHSIVSHPSNRFVYAGNLGPDRLLQFALDAQAGRLSPIGEGYVASPAGSGPRHLVFSRDASFLYVVGELSGSVTTYRVDADSGALSFVSEVSGVPRDSALQRGTIRAPGSPIDKTPRVWASDIHITPDGRFLYIAERTNSTVSLFSVDEESGALTYHDHFNVEKQPRGFNIDPQGRFMVVAGEVDTHIGVYSIDAATGTLQLLSRYPAGRGANWVEIVEAN